jgi:hypothetical protein
MDCDKFLLLNVCIFCRRHWVTKLTKDRVFNMEYHLNIEKKSTNL